MDVIHSRSAGLDTSKKDAKVCVRINGAGRRKTTETVTTFGATTRQIMALRDHLAARCRVTVTVTPGDSPSSARRLVACRSTTSWVISWQPAWVMVLWATSATRSRHWPRCSDASVRIARPFLKPLNALEP